MGIDVAELMRRNGGRRNGIGGRSTSERVSGLHELGEAMRKLSSKVSTKIAWQATGAAAKIIKEAAIANIIRNGSRNRTAVDTGNLRDSLIIKRVPASQRKGLVSEHYVTARGRPKHKGKKKSAYAPHAFLVEFGTVKMPAEPFLRPAYEGQKQEAKDAMIDKLSAGIERAVKSL